VYDCLVFPDHMCMFFSLIPRASLIPQKVGDRMRGALDRRAWTNERNEIKKKKMRALSGSHSLLHWSLLFSLLHSLAWTSKNKIKKIRSPRSGLTYSGFAAHSTAHYAT
jgi:hypothetical protein